MNTITKKLNILVVEDTFKHQQAARLQLADHNVTVVGTYREGNDLLKPTTDWEKFEILPKEVSYKERIAACTTQPAWDVVLLDQMLPADMCGVNGTGQKLEGQEMPLGTILALLALKNGCKNVVVVTDANHHHHPASAALDAFGGNERFQIGDANVFITNYGTAEADAETFELIDGLDKSTRDKKYPHDEEMNLIGTVSVKPWKRVLEKVMGTYVAKEAVWM